MPVPHGASRGLIPVASLGNRSIFLVANGRAANANSEASCVFLRPFLELVYNALECGEDDYYALFVLCLLYAMSHNKG